MQQHGFCPRCGSTNVRRSRRRGLLERVLLRLLGLRPYRCEDCDERFLHGYSKSADATTERSVLAKNANPAAANLKNPTAALHAGREQKMLRAKGLRRDGLTVSLPSVCLGAGLPQTPGRGSRPPRALPSHAHNSSCLWMPALPLGTRFLR